MRHDILPECSFEHAAERFMEKLAAVQTNVFAKENIRFDYKLEPGAHDDQLENFAILKNYSLDDDHNIRAIGDVLLGAMNKVKEKGGTWRRDQVKQPVINEIYETKNAGDPDQRLAAGTLLNVLRTAYYYRDNFACRFKKGGYRREQTDKYSNICAEFINTYDVCLVTVAEGPKTDKLINK